MLKHKQLKYAYRSTVGLILRSSPMQTDIMHPMLIKLLAHQVINRHSEMFATKEHIRPSTEDIRLK